MKIGAHQLETPIILAPMSGITDYPFREVARRFGVGMTVSEMVATNVQLRDTKKSILRRVMPNESGVTAVQLLGNEPNAMAEAAKYNVDLGASIIDINMGCPAKKVLKKAAGSALLADEKLVGEILDSVVSAVNVPVTLKIRTGFDRENKNALSVAKIAQSAGIRSLAIHGRTRACKFNGLAEHDTVKMIKQSVSLPVVVNGDIDSVDQAQRVKNYTQADAVMIGRGALGQPWMLRQLRAKFDTQIPASMEASPSLFEQKEVCLWHLEMLYCYYGIYSGVRIGRKHLRWYLQNHIANDPRMMMRLKGLIQLQDPTLILSTVASIYDELNPHSAIAA